MRAGSPSISLPATTCASPFATRAYSPVTLQLSGAAWLADLPPLQFMVKGWFTVYESVQLGALPQRCRLCGGNRLVLAWTPRRLPFPISACATLTLLIFDTARVGAGRGGAGGRRSDSLLEGGGAHLARTCAPFHLCACMGSCRNGVRCAWCRLLGKAESASSLSLAIPCIPGLHALT